MNKGSKTKKAILKTALNLTSEVGLEGLTIGALAKLVGMSKSGLYAHFKSKEDLQIGVLDAAADLYADLVVLPALREPRGTARVRALFEYSFDWHNKGLSGGCPFLAASTELDDKTGPVRDRLVFHLKSSSNIVARAVQICIEEGQFRKDLDIGQFVFEFWGALYAHHHYSRLIKEKDARGMALETFRRLLSDAGA